MSLRNDPTRTTTTRHAFERELRALFGNLAIAVAQKIDTEDALGLRVGEPLALNVWVPRFPGDVPLPQDPPPPEEPQVWRFRTNPEKVAAFRDWLQRQVDRGILKTDHVGAAWAAKYIESAYRQGRLRAYLDSQGKRLDVPAGFLKGSQAEFLRTAFGQPEQLAKVALLATRTFEALRGITATMAAQLNRILATALLEGTNPRVVARTMVKNIQGLSKARALMIARTEIIHAHAEGQLDSFEALGVREVGVYAEWSTAGDDRVCSACHALEGALFTVAEARGLIPRHPNCRCAWIPATDVRSGNRRRSMLAKVKKSVTKTPTTRWAGKGLVRKTTRGGKPRPSGKGKRKR